MSRIPTGMIFLSSASIFCASRCASGTPRRRMPMNTSLSRSSVRSRISCASRTSVRSISDALISWDFSRVRVMGGKRFRVAYGRSKSFQIRFRRPRISLVSFSTSSSCFSVFRETILASPFSELVLDFGRQLRQARGVLQIALVIRLEDGLSLRFAVRQLRVLFLRWKSGCRVLAERGQRRRNTSVKRRITYNNTNVHELLFPASYCSRSCACPAVAGGFGIALLRAGTRDCRSDVHQEGRQCGQGKRENQVPVRLSGSIPASGRDGERLRVTARFSGRSALDLFGGCVGLGDSFDFTLIARPCRRTEHLRFRT